MDIVFATNNLHKLEEIRVTLDNRFTISGLKEKGIFEEIPETKDTLKDNAIEKAMFIYSNYGYNCFADDTGLEVESLNNQPGVYSARYAGLDCSFEDNVNKLLSELNGTENRKAVFRTVIALIDNGVLNTFEGHIDGIITKTKKGSKGFGYDPVFLPVGSTLTFAEMTLDEKNKISHRALAFKKLANFLSV